MHKPLSWFSLVAVFSMALGCSSSNDSTSSTAQGGSAGASGSAGSAGNSGSAGAAGSAGSSGASGTGGTSSGPVIEIGSIQTAQTHVVPEAGLHWDLADGAHELHLVANRDVLLLVDLGDFSPEQGQIEVRFDGQTLGTADLLPPSGLGLTEDGGAAMSTTLYSAKLQGSWIKPGASVRVTASNGSPSAEHSLNVGVDSEFDMWTLPFYLFGSNDQNAPDISKTAKPDQSSMDELYQKWAISKVNFKQHPAQRLSWPYIIVGPRDGNPAMRVNNANEQLDGFAVMSAVLDVLGALRDANGESNTNNQYYAPLLMLDAQGQYYPPGGGLGGGSKGTGDYDYLGIFIHEQGHAFGMPHAADGYADGNYPYVGGSLLGSAWGFDAQRNEFLAPYLPPHAETFEGCQDDPDRQKDAQGRCVKQDPMQSGSGDQAPGYKYTMFSDFNASVIQHYFEGTTTIGDGGAHTYDGGTIFVDPSSSTGYSRWDSIDKKRVEVSVETVEKGLYGFDAGLPATSARNVPVHAIVFTLSHTNTPEVSQIYPPLSFNGNLIRQVDPTSASDLATITPNTGDVPWYCHASGCDYTLRATYSDDSTRHVLIRGGFRPWFDPEGTPEAATDDPNDGASYLTIGVNIPGDKPLKKVEILDTPKGWNGPGDNPSVLLSWDSGN